MANFNLICLGVFLGVFRKSKFLKLSVFNSFKEKCDSDPSTNAI